ncbi:MAG: pyrroline-5-carboxylate reductase [Magnetococcales bacterium]|nr:pyrroline-5-carboxylate reductase [Magnetococcales bacterium]
MPSTTTIAFLGGGNMATALIKGLLNAGVPESTLRVAEPNPERRELLARDYSVSVFGDSSSAVVGAEVVVIAVKPGVVPGVLDEIRTAMSPQTLVISIAAGVSMGSLVAGLLHTQPIIRVMPNTPALIGAGVSVFFSGPGVSAEKEAQARWLLEAVGEVARIDDEKLMDGVTALSGSGPAYVYLLAEALSDGGVACGLPRDLADRLAVGTLMGSAKLIAETGRHPGELKNQVTSPGGTTIAGLAKLEQAGVRGAMIGAVMAAWERSRALKLEAEEKKNP